MAEEEKSQEAESTQPQSPEIEAKPVVSEEQAKPAPAEETEAPAGKAEPAPKAAKPEAPAADAEAEKPAPAPAKEDKAVAKDEPKAKEDTPKKDDPKAKAGAPKKDDPKGKADAPKKDEPKGKADAPKKDDPKAEEAGPPKEKKKEDVFAELGLDPSAAESQKIIKAKGSKHVHQGIVHIHATFNNTKVTVSDMAGNVIGWSSAGKLGFRGSRKSTAYAAQLISQDACRQAMGHGLKTVEVRVKGPGSGRESAVRAVQSIGLEVTVIRDVTSVPHNGCRPPKARRV